MIMLIALITALAPQEPVVRLDLADGASATLPVQIIVLLTMLSFIPTILVSTTCFTRLIVVFHFVRVALGTQETPSNQVLLGLALFLTMFVMATVGIRLFC